MEGYEHTRARCSSLSSKVAIKEFSSFSAKHLLYGTNPLAGFWGATSSP